MKTLLAGLFALALITAPVFAGENCCDKAKKDGKECSHKCCHDAKAAGKSCEKCSAKSDEGKHKGEEKK
jgi:hypothetical protein